VLCGRQPGPDTNASRAKASPIGSGEGTSYREEVGMTVTPLSIRRQKALALADFSSGRGLEIGPLNQPLVTKNMVDVHYVDVFSAAHLRDHYALDPNVKVEDIPDIDFVLSTPDGFLSLSEAVQPGAPFAWVIASHVVEHVPDVISWLQQIAEIIDDEGLLLLVVPDRRFTFDILRPATTVGQMLHAHELKDVRPSVRAVYDHFRSVVNVGADEAWQGSIPGVEARMYDLEGTIRQVELAREGHYVDSHVWTFTTGSFVDQIAELGRLGLCDFVMENVAPTAENQLEFFAVLRRIPRGMDNIEVAATREAMALRLADNDPVSGGTHAETERLVAMIDRLEDEASKCQLASHEQIRIARERTRELEEELAQLKSSQRWRVGGVAAVPAAAVKRIFAR
jgi:hypothetical protein